MAKVISKDNNPAYESNTTSNISLTEPGITGVDDYGHSKNVINQDIITTHQANGVLESIKNASGLRRSYDIDYFNRYYRFGVIDPYTALSKTKEFLFFTKPDLYIYHRLDTLSYAGTTLRPELEQIPFWVELSNRYPEIIKNLQSSCKSISPFNFLLGNTVRNNLSTPGLSANMVETPVNMYGVGYSYRGSSESSDDNFDFSLEFKDTKDLVVYRYFKAYEEYETLKHHGVIGPYKKYIEEKIIHDQFAVYKFLVDEDMETIIYYAKYYGVMPTGVPRDVFSDSEFDDGLKFSVDFKAAFFEDMNPLIISDFNELSKASYDEAPLRIDIYNDELYRMDNRPCTSAKIIAEKSATAPGGYRYKLKWRGYDFV